MDTILLFLSMSAAMLSMTSVVIHITAMKANCDVHESSMTLYINLKAVLPINFKPCLKYNIKTPTIINYINFNVTERIKTYKKRKKKTRNKGKNPT